MGKTHIEILKGLGACSEAVCWAGTQPDMAAVWDNCERADWMLWLAAKAAGAPHSQARKKLVGCASECAATAIQCVKNEEWAKGLQEAAVLLKRYSESDDDEAAKADVIRASELAREIRRAYAAAYAAYAADAAADAAAYAADAAAYAAYAAAYAAYAAYAAAYADADAARKKALKDLCAIVRRHYPVAPEIG